MILLIANLAHHLKNLIKQVYRTIYVTKNLQLAVNCFISQILSKEVISPSR